MDAPWLFKFEHGTLGLVMDPHGCYRLMFLDEHNDCVVPPQELQVWRLEADEPPEEMPLERTGFHIRPFVEHAIDWAGGRVARLVSEPGMVVTRGMTIGTYVEDGKSATVETKQGRFLVSPTHVQGVSDKGVRMMPAADLYVGPGKLLQGQCQFTREGFVRSGSHTRVCLGDYELFAVRNAGRFYFKKA